MNNVWILESGEYSYRHIVGVFATEQAAEETRERLKSDSWPYDSLTMTAWRLDEAPMAVGYEATVVVRNGTIPNDPSVYDNEKQPIPPGSRVEETWFGKHGEPIDACQVSARNESAEGAVKVAIERAAQIAAEWDLHLARHLESRRP